MGARLWLLIPECLTAAFRARRGVGGGGSAVTDLPQLPLPGEVMGAVRDDPSEQPYPHPAVRPAAEPRLRAGTVRVSLQAGLLRAQRRDRCVPCPPSAPHPPAPQGARGDALGHQTPPFHPQCRLRMPLAWRAAGAGRAVRAAGTMRPARCRRTARCVRPCCAARRAACWPCSSACCSLTTAGGARREQRGVPTPRSHRLEAPPGGTSPLQAPGAADGPLSPQRIRASGVVLLETILFGSLLLYFPVSARPTPPPAPAPPCRKPHRPWAAPCCLWGRAVGLCRGSGLAPRRTQHFRTPSLSSPAQI